MPAHRFQSDQVASNANWAAGSTVDDFGASGIAADVIAESTSATGVTVDGMLIKDGSPHATTYYLDADDDSTITEVSDDIIDFKVGGEIVARMTLEGFQVRGNEAITATTGGGTTGLISPGTSFVTVTSDSADKQISLPLSSVGDEIWIQVGATGCELISAVATHKVNNVVVGATNELALAANNTYVCKYVAADAWIVRGFTNLGADVAALVPDALV